MAAVTVPAEYGYVLLATVSTFFVNTYHVVLTSKHRKASGIKYPVTYATEEQAAKDPKAFAFNCAQRAHANFTETLTPAVGAILIAGLRFPLAAAGLGAVWSVARAAYASGYAAYGPQARQKGGIPSTIALFSLYLTAAYSAISFVLEK
ncbi:membrane-associated proteins in eicosanoid and glutathione metabolism [Podospora didyma]|uniref:Membrane-associated proteins in eicosanoid and glutathione metabolism n=1 Tax=Podospora didyma TaxID=330526 RepID=A0AAE0NC62_9PEZI|nr:membrane-associated proteins in eicosanoid and glutathione metabolism [Podospora didyma]